MATKIWLSDTDGYFHIKSNGNNFSTIVDLCKSQYLQYDNLTKSFYIEPNVKCKDIYYQISDYDDIEITDEDKDLIEHISIYPPSNDLKKVKYSIDKELLELHPPLIGVAPNEDYQKNAIKDFIQKNVCFLNIFPRLGKSYISCIGIGTLMKLNQLNCVLAIMRPEGLVNFACELVRFIPFVTEDDIIILDKDHRDIENYFNKKFILCSYNTWRLCDEYYKKQNKITSKKPKKPFIKFENWYDKKLLLLDECQSICGDSLQSHYTIIHSVLFDRRCCMSGSVGYNFEKTYNIAKILTPNRLSMTKSEWWKYITTEGYSPFKRDIIPERLKEFQDEVLKPIMTTYGEECLKTTENYIHNIYVEMNEKMRLNYKQICNNVLEEIGKNNNGKISMRQLKLKFPYLRQCTDDLSLLDVPNWNMEKDNPKIEVLSSFLEKKIEEENRKVIIWCNSPRTMQKLNDIYAKYNPICVSGDEQLCGIKREDRPKIIEEIKTSEKCKLLIANSVLSTSVSFWQFSVNIYWCVPIDPDYYSQSIRRIMGSGQKRDVETVHFLFTQSIDNYLYESIINKMKTKNYFDSDEEIPIDKLKLILNPKHKYTLEGKFNFYS